MSATVKIIPSNSASACIDYLQGDVTVTVHDQIRRTQNQQRARVLFATGQHCRPETAKEEFKALRVQHGRDGEMRTVPAKYVPEDELDGVEPTHLKVGKNYRAAKAGEQATHLKVPPLVPYEKRAEVFHSIISFAPDTVNRDDPEQCRRAFDAVRTMFAEDYSGVQAELVAHGDAKGSAEARERGEDGKFHVHIAANATIHSDMEVDGRTYKAGQRMAGALTRVDTIRARWDQFLETRGHEFGLAPQDRDILPEVGSPEYRATRRTNQDFWENERGEISDHDRARRGMESAFASLAKNPDALKNLDRNARVQLLADEVQSTGDLSLKLRSTKAGEQKIRSFVVPERTQAIGGTKLGARYTHDGITEQLDLIAAGQWKPYERKRSGPVKPIAKLDAPEVEALQQHADELAQSERAQQELDQWIYDWSEEHELPHADFWSERGMTGSPADRLQAIELMHEAKAAEKAVEPPSAPSKAASVDDASTAPQQSTPASAGASQSAGKPNASANQPVKPSKPLCVGRLSSAEMRDRELIAIVRKERADGGAYVDFELAAHDAAARGKGGLHLQAYEAQTKDRAGQVRQYTNTWQQLSAFEYEQLREAAGDNHVEMGNRSAYAVRGNVKPTVKHSGYAVDTSSMSPSTAKPIGDDVLQKQRAAEQQARKQHLANLKLSRQEVAFNRIKAAQEQQSRGGYER